MRVNHILFVIFKFTTIYASPIGISPMVFGGVEVDSITRFPYQTVIFARSSSGSSLSSGAILSPKYIITCAHCISGSNNVSVFYGSEKISSLDYNKNQVVLSENYRIHPEYSTFFNDIALIKMNFDIIFSGKHSWF